MSMTTKTRTVDDKANEAIRQLVSSLPIFIFANAIATALKRPGSRGRRNNSATALQSSAR